MPLHSSGSTSGPHHLAKLICRKLSITRLPIRLALNAFELYSILLSNVGDAGLSGCNSMLSFSWPTTYASISSNKEPSDFETSSKFICPNSLRRGLRNRDLFLLTLIENERRHRTHAMYSQQDVLYCERCKTGQLDLHSPPMFSNGHPSGGTSDSESLRLSVVPGIFPKGTNALVT